MLALVNLKSYKRTDFSSNINRKITSFNIFPKSKDAKKAPIGLALIISPTISSVTPLLMAYGGKNGVMTDKEEHIKKLQKTNST
jgi:hypothetical protein